MFFSGILALVGQESRLQHVLKHENLPWIQTDRTNHTTSFRDVKTGMLVAAASLSRVLKSTEFISLS